MSPVPVFEFLHQAQLANTVTGLCTCMAGVMPMLYCFLVRQHPPRWFFVYFCILLTGIPTVWLHSDEGNRIASATDVGSNIFLTWSILMAVAGDFLHGSSRKRFRAVVTFIDFAAIAFLFYEAVYLDTKFKAINLGDFGQFYLGETILIMNSWFIAGLFFAFRAQLPKAARPVIVSVFAMFFVGMILASAANDIIWYRIFAWHAIWHIVGAFALVTLWVFNEVRITELEKQGKTL
jgi:hypothetical protein